MNKMDCDVVKDMMPLYVDGVCSEHSKQLVESHLKECASCRELWQSYGSTQIPHEIKEDSAKTFKNLTFQVKKKNRIKALFIVLITVSISIIMMICFSLVFLGLLSLGNEDYLTIDINNYGIHQGHVEGEKGELRSGLYIFPKEISVNAIDTEFLYSCRAIGFGIDYQQYLKCTYSDEEYQAEVDRLKNIQCEIHTRNGTVVNRIEYSDTKFDYPAYITAYGGNRMYEYALLNDEKNTIIYVYLQTISNKRVAFDKAYLPKEYQNGKQLLNEENMDSKNIYFYNLGNREYQNFMD